MTMAFAADFRTGASFKGQKALSDMLGKSVRQVRRLIDTVNATPGSPVRIEQTARFRPEGRGRTSNQYRLVLTNRTPTSDSSSGLSGHPRPHEQVDQPDADVPLKEATNRTPEARLTGHESTTKRTPTSGDLSSMISTKRSPVPSACRQALVSPTPAPKQSTLLKHHYIDVFKRKTGMAPDWSLEDHAKNGVAFLGLAKAFNGDLEIQKQVITTAMMDEFSPVTDPLIILKCRDKFLMFGAPRTKGSTSRAPQRGVASHVQTGSIDDLESLSPEDHPQRPENRPLQRAVARRVIQ